ncbi:MAG: CopG family transcriptional regulator [bacterium]|nr:CopG family transcriptional regulator [bacterium]MDT8395273.1 CopG family transcriptional regulator [bacterium]
MKKKIKYTDEPLGDLAVIEDFLPPPEELVLKEDNVKVTISLSRSSVEYFKSVAKDNQTQYQKMIRSVLDHYASKYRQGNEAGSSGKKKQHRIG